MLLLHGWSGDVERQWRGGLFPGAPDVLGGLAQSFRVLAPDLRGHGESAPSLEVGDYGRQAADDLLAVLDFFEVPRAAIVAYSMSATIGLFLASVAPERVSRLILGDSLGNVPGADLDYILSRASAMRAGLSYGEMLALESELSEEQVQGINALVGPIPNSAALAAAADGSLEHRVDPEAVCVPVHILSADPGVSEAAQALTTFPVTIVPQTSHMDLFLSPQFVEEIKHILGAPHEPRH